MRNQHINRLIILILKEGSSVLTVMSIGAGAMVVSHANDSYFWVVAEFTGMDIKTAYKSHTVATGIQGVLSFLAVLLLTFVLL